MQRPKKGASRNQRPGIRLNLELLNLDAEEAPTLLLLSDCSLYQNCAFQTANVDRFTRTFDLEDMQHFHFPFRKHKGVRLNWM